LRTRTWRQCAATHTWVALAAVLAVVLGTAVACHSKVDPGGQVGSPLPAMKPVPDAPRIPIALAMELIVQQANQNVASTGPATTPAVLKLNAAEVEHGRQIYTDRCASCHGVSGKGNIPTQLVSAKPYVQVRAQSFDAPLDQNWQSGVAQFTLIVSHGLPGRMMPGTGTLTRQQMSALYGYVLTLAAQPPTGAPVVGP